MAEELEDKQFIETVVKAIVDKPEAVKVERTVDEMGVLLTLAIDPTDMGKIIGKEGRTAKALRTLLRVLGAKNNSRLNLKILEPEGSTRPIKSEEPVMMSEKTSDETPSVTPSASADEEEKTTDIV